jgi:hypothetical protein
MLLCSVMSDRHSDYSKFHNDYARHWYDWTKKRDQRTLTEKDNQEHEAWVSEAKRRQAEVSQNGSLVPFEKWQDSQKTKKTVLTDEHRARSRKTLDTKTLDQPAIKYPKLDIELVKALFEIFKNRCAQKMPTFKSQYEILHYVNRSLKGTYQDVLMSGFLLILGGFKPSDFEKPDPSGEINMSPSKASRLMKTAACYFIVENPDIMPDSWMTLSLICKIAKRPPMLSAALEAGVIHKRCTQEDIRRFICRYEGKYIGEKFIINLTTSELERADERREMDSSSDRDSDEAWDDHGYTADDFEELAHKLEIFLRNAIYEHADGWGLIVSGKPERRGMRLKAMVAE